MGLEEFKNLTEIAAERSYTRKVYDLGNGKKRYRFHTAHKHYKASLLEGGGFKDIDCTLAFDDTLKAWVHTKASYHPQIPEYADGEFDFFNCYEGVNHHIKARPVADHVKGVLTNGAEDGNFVLYKDAFGKGIDLKVYAYHHGIKKVIIINEKPAEIKDLVFKFELTDLTGLDFKSKDDIAINVSSMSANYDFKDKTIKVGKDGKYSFFRNALMWDSSTPQFSEPVKIHLEKSGSKVYIVKTVPKSFLEKAVYPVMTDHPTSYYAGAGDGSVQCNGSSSPNTWSTVHDATNGSTADYTNTSLPAPAYIDSLFIPYVNSIVLRRLFLPVDTSGIDDGASITAVSYFLYATGKTDTNLDGYNYIAVVQTSQASNTALVTEDYDQIGSTKGSGDYSITDISINAYLEVELNATGISWVSKTGYTKLGMRLGNDFADVAGGQNKSSILFFASSEDTSGTKDPYLDVTVSAAAGPANLKSYNTNLKANIKTINTNAIANIKSLNTIT